MLFVLSIGVAGLVLEGKKQITAKRKNKIYNDIKEIIELSGKETSELFKSYRDLNAKIKEFDRDRKKLEESESRGSIKEISECYQSLNSARQERKDLFKEFQNIRLSKGVVTALDNLKQRYPEINTESRDFDEFLFTLKKFCKDPPHPSTKKLFNHGGLTEDGKNYCKRLVGNLTRVEELKNKKRINSYTTAILSALAVFNIAVGRPVHEPDVYEDVMGAITKTELAILDSMTDEERGGMGVWEYSQELAILNSDYIEREFEKRLDSIDFWNGFSRSLGIIATIASAGIALSYLKKDRRELGIAFKQEELIPEFLCDDKEIRRNISDECISIANNSKAKTEKDIIALGLLILKLEENKPFIFSESEYVNDGCNREDSKRRASSVCNIKYRTKKVKEISGGLQVVRTISSALKLFVKPEAWSMKKVYNLTHKPNIGISTDSRQQFSYPRGNSELRALARKVFVGIRNLFTENSDQNVSRESIKKSISRSICSSYASFHRGDYSDFNEDEMAINLCNSDYLRAYFIVNSKGEKACNLAELVRDIVLNSVPEGGLPIEERIRGYKAMCFMNIPEHIEIRKEVGGYIILHAKKYGDIPDGSAQVGNLSHAFKVSLYRYLAKQNSNSDTGIIIDIRDVDGSNLESVLKFCGFLKNIYNSQKRRGVAMIRLYSSDSNFNEIAIFHTKDQIGASSN